MVIGTGGCSGDMGLVGVVVIRTGGCSGDRDWV